MVAGAAAKECGMTFIPVKVGTHHGRGLVVYCEVVELGFGVRFCGALSIGHYIRVLHEALLQRQSLVSKL